MQITVNPISNMYAPKQLANLIELKGGLYFKTISKNTNHLLHSTNKLFNINIENQQSGALVVKFL
jgi:hypothetical protein